MATKFADFLEQNKIDPRRILAISKQIERLRREDRVIKLSQRQARNGEGGDKKEGEEPKKPRSGRPVTQRLVDLASAEGGRVSGAAKTRLLRAVNRILEQKKKDAITLKELF